MRARHARRPRRRGLTALTVTAPLALVAVATLTAPLALASADAPRAADPATALDAGRAVSLRVTTPDHTARYLRSRDGLVRTDVPGDAETRRDAGFVVRAGLADPACTSFESRALPGRYLRHRDFRARVDASDDSELFRADATFCARPGLSGTGVSFEAYNSRGRFLRHFREEVWISADGGTAPYDATDLYADDVSWQVTDALDAGADPGPGTPSPSTPPPPTTPPAAFGNTTVHPDRLGIYMVPDLPGEYLDWDRTERSLRALDRLLPDAWIRWDNETGHRTDTPGNVEQFVSRANAAGVEMIVTASAVDGYDNWWARGGSQPTVSIRQIADGPYLTFADRLRRTYPNVRFVETINEPDTQWFVSDPDDVGAWRYYLDKLYAASGDDRDHLLGPSTAFRDSAIRRDHAARAELRNFSYHTYGGWQALEEVPGKDVYVTEYGDDRVPADVGNSPGYLLADLWQAERNGKLSGGVKKLFYVNLQGMMRPDASEGDHFAFSGQLRALAAYRALGAIAPRVHADPERPDFLAADDGSGKFGMLLFNREGEAMSGQTRTVPGTSLGSTDGLTVLTVTNAATGAARCEALGSSDRVRVSAGDGSVSVTATVDPRAAVLVSTTSCGALLG